MRGTRILLLVRGGGEVVVTGGIVSTTFSGEGGLRTDSNDVGESASVASTGDDGVVGDVTPALSLCSCDDA